MGCGSCGNFLFDWLGGIFGYVVQLFYELFHNYGVAIILFTIVTRLLMFPLTIKQQKTSAAQARLQPKLAQLQARYGNDKVAYNEAMQELYQKEGVSPTGGCLPMLIQFPLFIGMYQAISRPLTCVLHLGKERIEALLQILGISSAKGGYYEVNAIQRLRDLLNGIANGTIAVSSGDVSASSLASISDVVSGTVVSGSAVSATDAIAAVDTGALVNLLGEDFDAVHRMCNAFNFLGFDLLQTAAFWNMALIIAVLVFVAQVLSMVISNNISKMPTTQGCNPNLMAVGMGAFSLFISFSVPAAFPLYWMVSSILAPVQTWVTKEYFGPVIINAKSEAQRNERLKREEQEIIDSVTRSRGLLELAPSMPGEKQTAEGGVGIQGGSKYGSSKKSKKGNTNRGNNSGNSDYRGKRK